MMQSTSIGSISEFLLHAGTNFQVLDLGRGARPLSAQSFLNMENGLEPPPWPRQQHAWFGIVFWNGQTSMQHYIWFLKLPLDERGCIVSAARNHFLQIIVDALGSQVADQGNNHNRLPDNPYSFVPGQTLMAQFHALVHKILNLAPSEGYDRACEYIQAPQGEAWRSLSIQNVTDLAVRADATQLSAIRQHFAQYAPEFTQVLMQAFESAEVPPALIELFALYAESEDENTKLAALRALSCHELQPQVQEVVKAQLQQEKLITVNALSVVAGRHFSQFDDEMLRLFFEKAALTDNARQYNGELFAGFFSDLVQVPALRPKVLALLRSPDRSETLSAAIGNLFSRTYDQQQSAADSAGHSR